MYTSRRCAFATLLLSAGAAAAAILPMEPPQPQQPAQPSHAEIAGTPDLEIADASKQLKRTHVTAYFTKEHAPNTSLLWCSTFQIAWDQFNKVGGPISLAGDPPMAAELSAHPFPSNALDDASYVATIGIGPDTIDSIKSELDRKFKGAASPKALPSKGEVSNEDLVAYAYLFKNLAFQTPFSRAPKGIAFGSADGRQPRHCAFGLFDDTKEWGEVASQVTVWHHASTEDFVIEVRTKELKDRLVIARLKPGATLKETTDRAMDKTKGEKSLPLTTDETILVPVLNFDITRSFDEILNIPCTTKGSPVDSIKSAKQNIRFRLDEKGAILKSDASIVAPTSALPSKLPRRFICDGPFLVLMLREGADTPYFAAWIDNTELLTPLK
jgi:hypothetical protein